MVPPLGQDLMFDIIFMLFLRLSLFPGKKERLIFSPLFLFTITSILKHLSTLAQQRQRALKRESSHSSNARLPKCSCSLLCKGFWAHTLLGDRVPLLQGAPAFPFLVFSEYYKLFRSGECGHGCRCTRIGIPVHAKLRCISPRTQK